MKFRWAVLSFALILPFTSFGQEHRDSLINVLRNSKDDTSKVMLLLKIADLYETNRQDSSIYYLEQVKALAERLKFKRGIYKYYEQRSIVSFTTGNYVESLNYNSHAQTLAQELGDSSLLSVVLGNAGIVYQYLGEFDKQIDKSLQALAVMEKRKETGRLSAMYHNIGNAYFNLNQYRKGVNYCLLALKTDEQFGGNLYKNRVLASAGQ
jgi:tetratricopeptide (TPR) repeat protein